MEQHLDLTRDVRNKIISKMDIETRRSLGIYTKLKVPEDLKNKLENMPTVGYSRYYASVKLGPVRRVYRDEDFVDNLYSLSRYFFEHSPSLSPTRTQKLSMIFEVQHITTELNTFLDFCNKYQLSCYDYFVDVDSDLIDTE